MQEDHRLRADNWNHLHISQHLLFYRAQAYWPIAPYISPDVDHGNLPFPYRVHTISPLVMNVTTQYEVNVWRNGEGVGKPARVFPGRPMSHEYLRSAYAAAGEIAGMSQSVVVISFEEHGLAMNPTHGVTINTHRVVMTPSSKTEVTQMIYRVTLPDYPIPIPCQPPVHFSSICERWIPVNIPNNVRMLQM